VLSPAVLYLPPCYRPPKLCVRWPSLGDETPPVRLWVWRCELGVAHLSLGDMGPQLRVAPAAPLARLEASAHLRGVGAIRAAGHSETEASSRGEPALCRASSRGIRAYRRRHGCDLCAMVFRWCDPHTSPKQARQPSTLAQGRRALAYWMPSWRCGLPGLAAWRKSERRAWDQRSPSDADYSLLRALRKQHPAAVSKPFHTPHPPHAVVS